MYHRGGKCNACGFNGVHIVRFETLETRLTRIRCTCAWRGPIRRNYALVADDGRRHTNGSGR